MELSEARSLTPLLPTYRLARHFMTIIDGVEYGLYRSTFEAIWGQRGSPQKNADWTDPDGWIPERLAGEEQALAMRLWRESGGELNPRYVRGPYYLTQRHDLLAQDQSILRITERGRHFLDEPEGLVVAEIDGYEGILTVLRSVAERGPGKRSDLLPDYTEFCHTLTSYRSDSVIKSSLYDRLVNLLDRGYIEQRGPTYSVTDAGLAYLDVHTDLVSGRVDSSKQSQLRKLAKDIAQEAREQLATFLSSMDPFKFEELIQLLLEEMGYTDVETTSPVNDKGIDVVANIELGISSVREVIQVKRHKGNINRPVLDGLRGSLHRFSAVRGTIITTGGFSQGTKEAAFERGAAPITLIDGEKLLDLLIAHEIGASRNSVEYIEFDAAKLSQFGLEEEETGSVD